MMYYALIDENNNNHVLENLEDKYPIFKKVKLGDCYIFNEKNDYTDEDIAYPFFISFDKDTLNYHIVPETRAIEEYMTNIRKNLKSIKESRTNWNGKITIRPGKKPDGADGVYPANGHKYIEIVVNQISFILEFQTLCFDGDTLNCYLDKIQFVAYPCLETLNYFSLNGDLHIMYPNKGDDNYCVGNNRVVYNTKFNCESDSEKVAESFIEFIKDILKDSSPKVYTHND